MDAVAEEAAEAFDQSKKESDIEGQAAIKLNEKYDLNKGLDLTTMSLEEQRKAITT